MNDTCIWCKKPIEEHGKPGESPLRGSIHDRLCAGMTSQFWTPKRTYLYKQLAGMLDNTQGVIRGIKNKLPYDHETADMLMDVMNGLEKAAAVLRDQYEKARNP
jgi:hypothetical protein